MEAKLQKLLDKVEYLGWRYTVYEDGSIGLENWSPAGEDLVFETQEGATADSLLHDLYLNASEYDPDEHVEMWVEARMSGRKDVPPARTLAKDADEIEKMYWELFYGAQDAYNGIHKARVELREEVKDKVKMRLDIDSYDELPEEEKSSICAKEGWREMIFSVEFDDGSALNYDLCYGDNDRFADALWWDDVIWTSPDGKMDVTLSPTYSIDNLRYEIDGEIYMVEIVGV